MGLKSAAVVVSVVAVLSTASIGVIGCSQPKETPVSLDHNATVDASEDADDSAIAVEEGDELARPEKVSRAKQMQGMTHLGPQDIEFDLRFIDAMTLYHEGAIALAKKGLQTSQRDDLKQLAQTIITTQQATIDQMKQWRQTWYLEADQEPMMFDSVSGETIAMPDTMQAAMRIDEAIDVTTGEVDQQFLKAMIPYHKGALKMAKQALEKSERSPLKKMARAILKTQRQEIKQMKQWQNAGTE